MMNAAEQNRVNEIYSDSQDMMLYLKRRYNAESKHEDWSDYVDHMKKFVAKYPELRFIKAGKRPFGFRVAFESYEILIACNNSSIYWKRVA